MNKPKLSIVVISYNMTRELPRTLFTLRHPYQKDIDNNDIEILVVDNGTNEPAEISEDWHNVQYLNFQNPTHSPVSAINYGLARAKAELVGVMIDGARMASPNLLNYAILANKLNDRSVISSMAYHLGAEVQMQSVLKGYNQLEEDKLLASVPWQTDGYRLFDISVFAGSSAQGWFAPTAESNALFMPTTLWNELGGYETKFQTPGGGLVNLDTYLRATELPNSLYVKLIGEGTFHQVHDGIATNQRREDASWQIFEEEYQKIRNKPFKRHTREALLFGQVNPHHKKLLLESISKRFT
jgi:glycosyltransferase involved in cell wall biosynthesis